MIDKTPEMRDQIRQCIRLSEAGATPQDLRDLGYGAAAVLGAMKHACEGRSAEWWDSDE